MGRTVQQERVCRAMLGAGFRRSEFRCRTEITRRRDRATGLRYSEYGDALANPRGRDAEAKLVELAEKVAASPEHVKVYKVRYASGMVLAWVTNASERDAGVIAELNHETGEWSFRRVDVREAA